jgi:hypothetical protein
VTSCGSTPTIDPIEQTTTSSRGLYHDAAADQYIYVWKTLPAWKGTCRRFSLALRDGQVKTALFQFK